MASIVAGTFQGYLKDRIPGAIPYALPEVFFVGAAIWWFTSLAVRREPVRAPGPAAVIVLAAIAVPGVYAFYPGTPLLVRLAGLRAWAEFPLACLMALTIIRNAHQARAYVGLLLILAAVTAVYGIFQYRAGGEAALSVSELARIRHGPTVFYNPIGASRGDFRAYSTFTFPAPFAGFLALGVVLATGIAAVPGRRLAVRLLCLALLPLLFLGIAVSGTRAAVVILGIELVLLGVLRGFSPAQLAAIPALLAGAYAGAVVTSGRILARWHSISHEGVAWGYVIAPITIALRSLEEEPFGMGLGRSGVGVPFAIFRSYPPGYFRGSDGDIGRAAVELGFLGVLLLLGVAIGLVPAVWRAVRLLRRTAAQDIALGAGVPVLCTGAAILIGSPLAAAPHAIIWWFFLGVLLKLATLEARQLLETGAR